MESQPYDSARYSALLSDHRPVVIETEDEHDHMLSVAEQLMEKGENLTPEEEKLLAMVVFLIEAFERSIEAEDSEEEEEEEGPVTPPPPHETLKRLMDRHQMEVGDVADVFGNPRMAQEALEGKREITRGQAKALGKLFRVPEKLFRD